MVTIYSPLYIAKFSTSMFVLQINEYQTDGKCGLDVKKILINK